MQYHQTGFRYFAMPDLFTEEAIFYRFIGLRAVDWDWEHRQLSNGLQGEIYATTRISMLKEGGSRQFHFNHTDLFQVPAPGIWLAASVAITSQLNQDKFDSKDAAAMAITSQLNQLLTPHVPGTR